MIKLVYIFSMLIFYFQSLEKETTLSYEQASKILNNVNKTTSDYVKNKKIIVTSFFDVFDTTGIKYNDSIKKVEEYQLKSNDGFIYTNSALVIYHSNKFLITVNKNEKFIFVKKADERMKNLELFNFSKNKINQESNIICKILKSDEKTIISYTDTINNFGQRITYHTENKIISAVHEFKLSNHKEQLITKKTFSFLNYEGNKEIDLLATEYLIWSGIDCKLNPKYKAYRLILIP